MKKCPYCAEEIQDAAIVCKHCGRDLALVAITQVPVKPIKNKTPIWLIAIPGILLLLCLCVLIIAIGSGGDGNKASPAQTQTAMLTEGPIATVTVTGTPIFWDSAKDYPQPVPGLYNQILDNKKNMTDIQFQEYLSSIKGQRIHLKATVKEVLEDNKVYFEATDGGFFDTVYLSGLPRDILLALNKDQIVEFDATIVDFTEFIITVVNVNDPIIYSIH